MKNRVVYTERKVYNKYDNNHYMLYLNEEILPEYIPECSNEEQGEPTTGYAYTGNQADGGTLIEATEDSYEQFVSGLIRLKYTADAESAINSNALLSMMDPTHERAVEFKTEWEIFQHYREECKENAKTVLS